MKSGIVNQIKNIVETLFRWFPFPVEPGLKRCGNPGRDSPVFLTANFDLTVRRVMQALQGQDCYLLVVNTKGVNVWCASVGGLLTSHHVISALKVSRISDLVDQRRLILPQLSACGVDPQEVKDAVGWDVVFGPVDAKVLPRYINNDFTKTAAMSFVQTALADRLEMAVCWSWMITLITILPGVLWFREFFFPLLIFIWVITFLVFSLWHMLPGRLGLVKGLFVGFLLMVLASGYAIFVKPLPLSGLVKLNIGIFLISLMVGVDSAGATPLWRSRVPQWLTRIGIKHREIPLKIAYDESKCTGCGKCIDVCPVNCFHMNEKSKNNSKVLVTWAHCIQCGACLKQCPAGAFSLDQKVA